MAEGRPTPRKPRVVVAALLFSLCFTTNVIISLLYPFAPGHLAEQGYSQFFIGFLFAVYSWSIFLSAPACAGIIRWFGRDSMLCVGIVTLSFFSATFGYAEELSFGNTAAMSVIYSLSRIFSGTGAALTNLTVFSMAADNFPHDLGKIMGVNEVVIGLGFTIGPPIGSILFVNFGFGPAFLIAALAVFLTLPLAVSKCVFDIRHRRRQASSGDLQDELSNGGAAKWSMLSVLNTRVVLSGIITLCGTFVFGAVQPSLAQHLQDKAGIGQTAIGGIFALLSATYSILGIPMGWIADNHGYFMMSTTGILVSGFALLLMGAPFYPAVAIAIGKPLQDVILWKDVGLLAILGMGQATLLVPALPAMKSGVTTDDEAATETVVTLFNCFQQFGLAIGPLAGAAVVQVFSFEILLEATGAVLVTVGAVSVVHCLAAPEKRSVSFDPSADETYIVDATAPLLEGGRTSESMSVPTGMTRRTNTAGGSLGSLPNAYGGLSSSLQPQHSLTSKWTDLP